MDLRILSAPEGVPRLVKAMWLTPTPPPESALTVMNEPEGALPAHFGSGTLPLRRQSVPHGSSESAISGKTLVTCNGSIVVVPWAGACVTGAPWPPPSYRLECRGYMPRLTAFPPWLNDAIIRDPVILISAYNSFSPTFPMMCSMYKLNNQGDKKPCYTPFLILNLSVVSYSFLTIAS